jgi:hypothetical protein
VANKENNVIDIQSEKDKKTIYRVIKNKDNPYVQINKTCLEDVRLSWKAKGLLAYMLSQPDNWVFYREELVRHSRDGLDSLKAAVKELSSYGYIKIVSEKDQNGKFVGWATHVYEQPEVEFPLLDEVPEIRGVPPEVEKPPTGFSTSGKSTATNNDLVLNNNNKNNNNNTDERGVVSFDEMRKTNNLVEELKKHGVSGLSSEKFVKAFPESRIKEVLSWATAKKDVRDLGATISAALHGNYNCSPPKVAKTPGEEKPKRTREECRSAYVAFWKTLGDEEKIKKFREIPKKYQSPVFEDMTKKFSPQGVLLETFVKTPEFAFMADLELPM